MDESADQIFEELQDIVQQAILREFPNPERKGCSGTDIWTTSDCGQAHESGGTPNGKLKTFVLEDGVRDRA